MKEVYVNEIKERDRVNTAFLVREKITAMAKNGKPYLTLKLMDKTGEVEGRVWDRVDEWSSQFDSDDFIRIDAKASVYMGKMQLVVQNLEKLAEDAVDLGDFLPVTSRSQDEMRQELDAVLDSLTNPYIEALLRAFFDDPEFFALYRQAPAAKAMHHAYLGGLLEHSLAIVALAVDVARRYPQIDRDLLISGALLHDVGKVVELTFSRSIGYSDEGKLVGHLVIGVQMIEDRVRNIPGFPAELSMMIKHLLLSHHGQYEFGSPKRPKFLEAVVLNFIDDLDSKINAVQLHLEKEQDPHHGWSSYHRLFDRYFYKGPKAGGPKTDAPTFEEKPPAMEQKMAAGSAAPSSESAKKTSDRKNYAKPLGATLGEQLKNKNLELFSTINEKGAES